MKKLAWTLFGAALAAFLALSGFALNLMPIPAGAERPAKVVVTFDSEADRLRAQLADLRLERDRLAADLSAMETDQNILLEDLSYALEERDRLRLRLEGGEARQAQASESPLVPEAGPAESTRPTPALLGIGLRAYRNQDYSRAYESWMPLAQAGNPRAQFFIGGLYNDGAGVSPDLVEAYVWLRRSDLGGYRRAETLLAALVPRMTPVEIERAESQVAEATFGALRH